MRDKRRFIVALMSVVVLVAALITGFVLVVSNIFSTPVPESFQAVRAFADSYSPLYYDLAEGVPDTYGPGLSGLTHDRVDGLLAELDLNGAKTVLAVSEYSSANAAEEALHRYRAQNRARVVYNRVEYHLFGRGYWTATANGRTHAGWRNGKWLVLLTGPDREAVKDLEGALRDSL